ncbi:hypothetical protein OESDEN_16262 [Oesophagostomum dentatum]|uniref:Selenoprotein F n=1 Tax=Oesophagostomum dentatum TaxID=61180 RepID=A0A0B1SFD2_OESDE|nr:hypothetical protein OESDEN_16262 [Oesophagostomum dentatum]
MRILLLFLTSCIMVFAEIEEYSLSREECRDAGFIPEELMCSSCSKLSKFNLEILVTDCNACCTKDEDDKHEKYPMADMEVCECNLGRFPQVQAFVQRDMAANWGGKVRIRHVRGVLPQIKLKAYGCCGPF